MKDEILMVQVSMILKISEKTLVSLYRKEYSWGKVRGWWGEMVFVLSTQYLTIILYSTCFKELWGIFIQMRWSLPMCYNDGVQREMYALLGVLRWTSLTQTLLLDSVHFVRHLEDDCSSLPCILKDQLSSGSSHQ